MASRKIVKLQISRESNTSSTSRSSVRSRYQHHGFTKEFNARTADQAGLIIPVVISVYEDRSFTFITKHHLAAVLLKSRENRKGSGEPNKTKVATVSSDQVKEIAELKMADPNAADVESNAHGCELHEAWVSS